MKKIVFLTNAIIEIIAGVAIVFFFFETVITNSFPWDLFGIIMVYLALVTAIVSFISGVIVLFKKSFEWLIVGNGAIVIIVLVLLYFIFERHTYL